MLRLLRKGVNVSVITPGAMRKGSPSRIEMTPTMMLPTEVRRATHMAMMRASAPIASSVRPRADRLKA